MIPLGLNHEGLLIWCGRGITGSVYKGNTLNSRDKRTDTSPEERFQDEMLSIPNALRTFME